MALATSCPRCQTSFRVVPDQLKIRRGLVRCGACQHVFSGIDSLRYIDEPPPASPMHDRAAASASEISRLIAAETTQGAAAGSRASDSMEQRNRAPGFVQSEPPGAMSFESLASGAAPLEQSEPDSASGSPPDTTRATALEWPGEPATPLEWPGEPATDIGLDRDVPPDSPAPFGPAIDVMRDPQIEPSAETDAPPELLDASPDPLADTLRDGLIEPAWQASADDSGAGADPAQRLPGFDPSSFEDSRLTDALGDGSADAPTTDESSPSGTGTGGPWAANEDWLLDPIGGGGHSRQPVERRLDSAESGSADGADEPGDSLHTGAPANDTTARGDTGPSIWVDASTPPPGDTVIVIDAPTDRAGWPSDDWPEPDVANDAAAGEVKETGTPGPDAADAADAVDAPDAPHANGLEPALPHDEPNPRDEGAGALRQSPHLQRSPDSPESSSSPDSPTDSATAHGPASHTTAASGALAVPAGIGAVTDPDAVDFFAAPSRARGFTSRTNAFAVMACVVLSVTLFIQVALAARDWLAAWVPALEPTLSAMSSLAGLQVQAPRSLGALTLESFELQAGNVPGVLNMSALLRNRAGHIVRWPGMELTLTDGSGTVIVRKQLLPADYVGRGLPAAGVPAGIEQNLTVSLEGLDLQPTGYNVKLFYP